MDKVLLILQYQVNPIRCSLDFISTKIYCQIISQAGRVGHIHPIHIPSLSACNLQSFLKQGRKITYKLFTSHLCQPVLSSHFLHRDHDILVSFQLRSRLDYWLMGPATTKVAKITAQRTVNTFILLIFASMFLGEIEKDSCKLTNNMNIVCLGMRGRYIYIS